MFDKKGASPVAFVSDLGFLSPLCQDDQDCVRCSFCYRAFSIDKALVSEVVGGHGVFGKNLNISKHEGQKNLECA